MNANIILSGRSPDIVNALARGTQAAGLANQVQHQNSLRGVYQQHGAGIAQGDQGALNALATLDPQMAHTMRTQNAAGARADAQLGLSQAAGARAERQLQLAEEAGRKAAAQIAADASKRAEAEQEMQVLQSLLPLFQQGQQTGDMRAFNQAAAEHELSAQDYPVALAAATGLFDEMAKSVVVGPEAAKPNFEITDSGQFIDMNNPAAGARAIPNLAQPTPEPLTADGKRAVDQANGFIDPNAPAPVNTDSVDGFRKEFSGRSDVKGFREQATAFGRIVASASEPSAAGDLALIFNFMKVLDPGSVVRESEFATAAQASAWLQEQEGMGSAVPRPIASAIRMLQTGERLSDEQRADFVGRAERLYENSEAEYTAVFDQYAEIAKRRKYDVNNALIDHRYSGPRLADLQNKVGSAGPEFEAFAARPEVRALAAGGDFSVEEQWRYFQKYSAQSAVSSAGQ